MLGVVTRRGHRDRPALSSFSRVVDIGRARVFVECGFQWDGARTLWLTRARASYVMHCGPAFELRPRKLVSRLLHIAGAPSGDPFFDYFFALKTDVPSAASRALTTNTRARLAGEFPNARLQSNGRTVTIVRHGDPGVSTGVETAVEIVSEIARFRDGALADLERLPGARYTPPSGPWDRRRPPQAEIPGPVPVRVGPGAGPGEPVMLAWASCGGRQPSFDVAVDPDGGARGHVVPGALEPSVTSALPHVGAARLWCDGTRVRLKWPGLETDRGRLVAGARLVAALARGGAAGLYR